VQPDDDDVQPDDDDVQPDDDDVQPDDDDVLPPGTGELVITEVLVNPNGSDSPMEWFELYNATASSVDLEGWTFSDLGTDSFVVVGSLVVAPGTYVVLGEETETAYNGGAPVDYEYSTLMSLGNGADELVVTDELGALVDQIAWDDGATFPDTGGRSMNLDPTLLDDVSNDDGSNWCASYAPAYGTNGDNGTPGATNWACTP